MEQSSLIEGILWVVLILQVIIFLKVRELSRGAGQSFLLTKGEASHVLSGLVDKAKEDRHE